MNECPKCGSRQILPDRSCKPCGWRPLGPVAGSALDEQRNALAEARLRIITRYEHVQTWLKQPATEETLANWAGIVEGLRQARQIIGAMWDELPVPKPQAVIEHEAHMRRVIEEQNA